MKVYLVRYDYYSYDEYEGFVIVAENELDALHQANDTAKNNRYKFSLEHVSEVDISRRGIVLEAFNAG